MTILLNLNDMPATLDRVIDVESLADDVCIIVRGPLPAAPRQPVATTPSWVFDDNDLVTWEDAEWQ